MTINNLYLDQGKKLKQNLEDCISSFRGTYFSFFTGKNHGVLLVPLNNIKFHYDDKGNIEQRWRSNTKINHTHCETKLLHQFSTGIDTNLPVMIVRIKGEGVYHDGVLDVDNTEFEIVSGNHRLYMLTKVVKDITHFPVQVIESDDHVEIGAIGLSPNRTNPNVLKSGEEDVIFTGVQLIKSGKLKAKRQDIKNFVSNSDRYASPQSKLRMVKEIEDRGEVPLTFRSITDKSASVFFDEFNHPQKGGMEVYTKDGERYHSTVITKGYWPTRIMSAIAKRLDSGLVTLADGYVSDKSFGKFKDPNDPANITAMRAKIVDEYWLEYDMFDELIKEIKAGNIEDLQDIIRLESFIPQLMGDVKDEPANTMIDVFDEEIRATYNEIVAKRKAKEEKTRQVETQSDNIQDCVTEPLDDFLKTG